MRLRDFFTSLLAAGLLSFGASWFGLVAAEAAGPSVGPIEQAISVDLEYQETGSEVLSAKALFAPKGTGEATPFRKEPPSNGGKVRRDFLLLGGSSTNLMALLWEPPSLLYLDLNRNLDLTDDAQGVFKLSDLLGKGAFSGIRINPQREL